MIQCRKCKNIIDALAKYIGQTKRALRDRFGEHRRGRWYSGSHFSADFGCYHTAGLHACRPAVW